MAEVEGDVVAEVRVRAQEGEDSSVRRDVTDALGPDGDGDRLARRRAWRLDARFLAEDERDEEGVPGAPPVERAAVDLHAVRHLAEGEAQKPITLPSESW